jgi:hypothetical protein
MKPVIGLIQWRRGSSWSYLAGIPRSWCAPDPSRRRALRLDKRLR